MLIWGIALVLMAGLHLFVNRTRLGKAMRATAQDAEAARMMGVDVDRVIITAFFLGSALAGAAALIFGLYYNYTSFIIGYYGGAPGVHGGGAGRDRQRQRRDGRRHLDRSDRGLGGQSSDAVDRRDHLLDPGAGARLRADGFFGRAAPTKS